MKTIQVSKPISPSIIKEGPITVNAYCYHISHSYNEYSLSKIDLEKHFNILDTHSSCDTVLNSDFIMKIEPVKIVYMLIHNLGNSYIEQPVDTDYYYGYVLENDTEILFLDKINDADHSIKRDDMLLARLNDQEMRRLLKNS